jgi:methyltransferase (TIGR00027 family)
LIALSTVCLRGDPQWGHLVPPLAAEASVWFLEAAEDPPGLLLHAIPRRWFRRLARAAERLTIPGILLHYAARKRYLEEVVRTSLHEGFTQVVILGAGYDTLPLRLHQEFRHVLFFEADHPATQQAKRRALERRALPGTNLRFLPVDFTRERLEDRLPALPGCDAKAKTLFVAEGVLMYLRPEEVDGVFDGLRGRAGATGRFAFTFMEPQANGRIAFRNASWLVTLWLRWRGEPFRWGLRRDQLPTFLAARGFSLRDLATPATFRDRYLGGALAAEIPLAEGEYVCVADRAHAQASRPA